jgi:2-succinyl-5-enolpyruvyl-6-hydroxy-3-cyclohexene-1-carboxylate synthase
MAIDHDLPPNVNTLWASVFVDELIRCGLRHAVIAPGARSAPLVFQFAGRREVEDMSIIDERSAAFFALGLARATRRPVALLCTSGTAAANFHPAVCEAAHGDIPLLVLTGNRLADAHDCGAQQVMDQYDLYARQVRWFHRADQPEPRGEKLRYLRATACRAWAQARGPRPGPVHLDLPVRKPLEPVPDARDPLPDPLPEEIETVRRGRDRDRCWLEIAQSQPLVDAGTLDRLEERLRSTQRPLIIAATDRLGFDYREPLRAFAERASIPVFAEAGSNLRHWSRRGPAVVGAGDLMAAGGFHARFGRPDLILRLGHHPLTWALQWLVDEDIEQIQIAPSDHLIDPDHRLSDQIIADPSDLFRRLGERLGTVGDSPWLLAHRRAEAVVDAELDRVIADEARLSAPRFWHELGALLPDGCRLCYSSSMLVRHLETFMRAPRRDLELHFNRGLNGIDGVVSTAAGLAAAASGQKTVLVIGDVALRHDAQALMLAVEMGLDLTVFVVDNDGGEIFEYLPGADFERVHEKHFATGGHAPLADALPRAVPIDEPDDWDAFGRCAREALADRGPRLVRVATDRRADRALRARLIERVGIGLAAGTP